jgi:Rrf2 family transcriptional regulator, cysteine metabolism repressor
MKISTKGRYGTRMLFELALHEGEGPVQLKDIAQRQGISLQYLEHLVGPLIAAGIIRSVRGARGGVLLRKRPEEIKLSEVVYALEGPLCVVDCLTSPESCTRYEFCTVREIWYNLKGAMDGILESTTLQELVEKQKKKVKPVEPMYYI